MTELLLELDNCVGDGLAGVVIVAELLNSCLHIKGEVLLHYVINNVRKGVILPEDGYLFWSEQRAWVVHRSRMEQACDDWVVFAKCARDGGSDRIKIIFDPRGNDLAVRD
jgi:hypothetical protein